MLFNSNNEQENHRTSSDVHVHLSWVSLAFSVSVLDLTIPHLKRSLNSSTSSEATGRVAVKQPFEVTLETEKTYAWCKCGHSKKQVKITSNLCADFICNALQPFCDGSHKITAFKPVRFTVEEKKTAYLCGCKQTGTPPFCDGTHATESVLNAK